jgi:Trypsin-like peptidase domain
MSIRYLSMFAVLHWLNCAKAAPEISASSKPPTIDVKIKGITKGMETKYLEIKREGERLVGKAADGTKIFVDDSVTKLANSPALGTLTRNAKGEFQVTDAESAISSKFERFKEDLPGKIKDQALLERISKNVSEVDKLTEPLRKPLVGPDRSPASESPRVNYDQVKAKLTAITGDVRTAYAQALSTEDTETMTILCSLWSTARNEHKSYYGSRDPDNYSPATYLNMVDAALSSCKIIIDPNETHPGKASGVLIGPKTVLTCAHDVEAVAEDQPLQVQFSDHSGKVVSKRLAKRIFTGKSRDEDDEFRLDYAILSIIEEDPNDPVPAAQRKPVSLINARGSLDSPVYAIGHPGGGDLVLHDYARIVCPHELKEKDVPDFMLRLQADLLRANQLALSNVATGPAALEGFKKRYQRKGGSYFYRSLYNDSRIPVFGADTDTFKGDSGGPVLLRKPGGIVGILIEGELDNEFFTNATILSHERCLPITAVIEQLAPRSLGGGPPKSILEGWPEAFGVKIILPN